MNRPAVARRIVRAAKNALVPDRPVMVRVPLGLARGTRLPLNLRHQAHVALGLYEREVAALLRPWVGRDIVFYDLGAGSGYYALTFARASSSATVYAFEADPREAARLRKGARANDVDDRIEVVEGFVGAGTAGTIALDAVVAGGAPPPDVLKIDVEGAELDVLHGATRVLDDAAPVVFLEVHSAELREACRLVLEGHGYAVRSYEPKASLRGPRPLAGNAWLWAERSRRRP